MQVSFTAHTPAHSPLTIQRHRGTLHPHQPGNHPSLRGRQTQLMEARYGRFDAMKEARHINPYRDGDR